jgi:hypothetical protein
MSGSGPERERFVRDFLRHHGAKLLGAPHGPFTAELPPALVRALKVSAPTFAFRAADLAEHAGAALMVPGNALFDRILRLARGGGSVSRRYLKADRHLDAAAMLARALPEPIPPDSSPHALANGMQLLDPVYRPRILFTFRVAYRAFDGFDEIRSIMAEAPAGRMAGARAADGRDFFRNLNLADEPDAGIAGPPEVDVAGLLRIALVELERRSGPQVSRFAERAEALLARENERLQVFYVALIEEEKLRVQKRGGKAALAARPRKLEWLKRAQREMRLYAPAVRVSLLGLEEVWVPIRPLAAVGDGGAEEVLGELDLAAGAVHAVFCAVCGTAPAETVVCGGGHLLCPGCRSRCERCGRTTCQRCARDVVGAGGVCYDAASLKSDERVTCPACA